ncbi:TRAF3-interacting protein 1 isoform X3 [Gracilinanus agilis]|uniref:TRAF3-interacting protein 1 isoform X3 n=1 Tax=Gracilinanus agilis TaxID=191870 RepID=UPI001CFE68C9|nr:TRAF3-interacting protein 1 isoform X3 [Gracilinanus agilis]
MTGFMKGLYSDAEMKSDNVKDKDAKISFLQKTIDVVIMVSGEPLSVKPARIVAGHEPERTNELLQAIGKCCLNKLSSDDAVKRVLAGEKGDTKGKSPLTSKSQELDNKEFKEEDPRTHKEKEDRRNSEIKDRSTSRERKVKEESKDEESKARDKDREREKSKDGDRERHKDLERDKGKDLERDRNKNRVKQEREREKSRDKDRGNKDRELERDKERKSEGGKEKERLKERDREREREKERERAKDKDREKRKDRTKDGEHSREHEKDKIKEQERLEKKSTGTVENLSKKFSESPVKDTKLEMDKESDITNRVSRSLTSKGSRWRSKNSAEGDSTSDAEGEVGVVSQEKPVMPENMEMSSELAAGIPQRRMPRPGSARPAPPRIKRQDSAEVLVPERTGSGKMVSNVIIDTQNSDDEEDSQFVVEAAPQLSEMPEMETAPAVELEEDEKHGGLVKKILETKKDYEKLQQVPKPTEKERPLLLEAAWKKEKDIVSKEIEKLRTSIQTLCRSALPLGKIMDYIQEDMDAMQNELQVWHSENKQHAEALQKEQSITDCAVEPLKAELVELEQLIKDQQDKICAVKANILKNEEKIQKMVYSINISSRR